MAIVQDLAGLELPGRSPGTLDNPLNTPDRTNAGNPNGSLTPAYVGEIVLDTTNQMMWRAETLVNDSWQSFLVKV